MTIESDLQSLLSSMVGGRCYPLVNPDKVVGTSYIIFQVITGHDLLLSSTGEEIRMQIDVFGTTYDEVKALAVQVKTALEGSTSFSAVLIDRFDGYEHVTKEYRATLEFYIVD